MADQWCSPLTPVYSTNKTDVHDITEILLKMASSICITRTLKRFTYDLQIKLNIRFSFFDKHRGLLCTLYLPCFLVYRSQLEQANIYWMNDIQCTCVKHMTSISIVTQTIDIREGWCLIYVTYVRLRIMVSNTYSLCFCFTFLRLVYPMLTFSLHCPCFDCLIHIL